eukprot:PITA_02085
MASRTVLYTIACMAIFLQSTFTDAQSIGVCYGRVADNLPSPKEVAGMYKQYGIGKMRMYDADSAVLSAFENSGVEIMVGVLNQDIQTLASSQDAATQWFNTNIKPHYPAANIKYISVGHEILATDDQNAPFLLPAMRNLHAAIDAANLQNQIKVSTTWDAGSLLVHSSPPSAAEFWPKIAQTMYSILEFLRTTGSPFMADIYPYKSSTNNVSIDYVLFRPTKPVVDGNLVYHNLFDAIVDALISAMEAIGQLNIPIVITESGWPSSGDNVATVSNARTYNNNFIRHVLSATGTPKRPGKSIESFVFTMFNEDQKPGDIKEQNFGLFYPDTKLPLYPVQFK